MSKGTVVEIAVELPSLSVERPKRRTLRLMVEHIDLALRIADYAINSPGEILVRKTPDDLPVKLAQVRNASGLGQALVGAAVPAGGLEEATAEAQIGRFVALFKWVELNSDERA